MPRALGHADRDASQPRSPSTGDVRGVSWRPHLESERGRLQELPHRDIRSRGEDASPGGVAASSVITRSRPDQSRPGSAGALSASGGWHHARARGVRRHSSGRRGVVAIARREGATARRSGSCRAEPRARFGKPGARHHAFSARATRISDVHDLPWHANRARGPEAFGGARLPGLPSREHRSREELRFVPCPRRDRRGAPRRHDVRALGLDPTTYPIDWICARSARASRLRRLSRGFTREGGRAHLCIMP